MKKYYKRFRAMLMTFALGLASVFVFDGSLKNSDEVEVDLPEFQTDSTIFVQPKFSAEIPRGGGGYGGREVCNRQKNLLR